MPISATANTEATIKPTNNEIEELMITEENVATNATTAPTFRSLMDVMLTESAEAFPTALPATPATMQATKGSKFLDDIKAMVKELMSTTGGELTRKLLQADISADCTFGLLKFTRAIQDLEPWAMRLIDATGKYPSGFFQGTFADLGAYDECIETVVLDEYGTMKVRGQYCDVHLSPGDEESVAELALPPIVEYNKRLEKYISIMKEKSLPGIRLGLCVVDACNEQDLANIGNTLAAPTVKITVKDCVTNEYEGISTVQAWIIAFLAVLATVIAGGTTFELFTKHWDTERKNAIYYKCITAFSLLGNSKRILQVTKDGNPETRCYKFVFGLRFLSIFWICLGHSYATINENLTRLANAVFIFESWESPIISAGFMAVDTFFFMSGYLLYFTLKKQKQNRAIVAVIALVRRFIRGTIPMFFMIMCMYLLPLIASGPNSKEFYDRFYKEVRDHWWHLVAQIRNWTETDFDVVTMAHLWYLSADFQLFFVSVAVIQTFRRKKWLTVFIFAVLSLLCCGIAAWQIYGTNMTPFVTALHPSYRTIIDTTSQYYVLPFYHAVCFFSGCMTFTVVEQYGQTKISKIMQIFLWCIALSCGLSCVFMKLKWNGNEVMASEAKRMLVAFIDRILWSVCLAWFWFTCTTGRGGFVNRFLSWNGFVPLGRLSFGVYLIHVPFYNLMHRITRERRFYSHFILVSNCFIVLVWSYMLSFILTLICDLPVAQLEKLVFNRDIKNGAGTPEEVQKQHQVTGEDAQIIPFMTMTHHTSNNCRTER